jgi:predicted small integral membrane protein
MLVGTDTRGIVPPPWMSARESCVASIATMLPRMTAWERETDMTENRGGLWNRQKAREARQISAPAQAKASGLWATEQNRILCRSKIGQITT